MFSAVSDIIYFTECYFGQSGETSDFIVDCLEWWWEDNQYLYQEMVEFAEKIQLPIRLVYYPPYHSKYNPIERCWSCLEQYWNGAILDSVDSAINWASHMTWKGNHPSVCLVEGDYLKGVKLTKEELEEYLPFWQPSENLPKWDILVLPK